MLNHAKHEDWYAARMMELSIEQTQYDQVVSCGPLDYYFFDGGFERKDIDALRELIKSSGGCEVSEESIRKINLFCAGLENGHVIATAALGGAWNSQVVDIMYPGVHDAFGTFLTADMVGQRWEQILKCAAL